MPTDRFVYWEGEVPPQEAVVTVLRDYVSELAEVEWHEGTGRYYVNLPGKTRSAVGSIYPVHKAIEEQEKRWIEVFFHDDSVDIMTRMQDEMTCAIAEGFADLCVRLWGGRRGEDG